MQPHERVVYSPTKDRPPIEWPDKASVAVWVVPNVEHYEFTPPASEQRTPWPRVPAPDVQQYSFRDYGNRVGLWRMAELLDDLDITPTVSLNLGVLDHYPEIAALIRERGWAVKSHGIYNTRYLYGLEEETERQFYRDSVETLQRHTGLRLRGMLGPAISGTPRTPELMVEAGLYYHTDWVHDDQPVPILNSSGRLVSVPYNYELNDAPLFVQHYSPHDFAEANVAQFDRLHLEAERDGSGRVFCLALHPFLVGQPHVIGHLRRVLEHVKKHRVWMATGDEIADHYLTNHYDEQLAFARSVNEKGAGHAS